jgi:hypothetical protein
VNIGIGDLVYAAGIFHDPVYMLVLRLSNQIAKLYAKALQELSSYDKNVKLDGNSIKIFI